MEIPTATAAEPPDDKEIEEGYAAMAADEDYEREATEWIEGLIGDAWSNDE